MDVLLSKRNGMGGLAHVEDQPAGVILREENSVPGPIV
jgi:hypothetical protein